MKRKRYHNPLHQALEVWNRLPQNSGHYFGLSLALDDNLRIFQYHPGRLKLAPKQILTVPRQGDESFGIYRTLHAATQAPVVFSLKSVSTLLAAHYWQEAGSLKLPAGPRLAVGLHSLNSAETAVLVDGEGLFAWGQDLETVRDFLAQLDFQLSYQLQLLSLPERRSKPVLDGGWRLPALPQARSGIFSL